MLCLCYPRIVVDSPTPFSCLVHVDHWFASLSTDLVVFLRRLRVLLEILQGRAIEKEKVTILVAAISRGLDNRRKVHTLEAFFNRLKS